MSYYRKHSIPLSKGNVSIMFNLQHLYVGVHNAQNPKASSTCPGTLPFDTFTSVVTPSSKRQKIYFPARSSVHSWGQFLCQVRVQYLRWSNHSSGPVSRLACVFCFINALFIPGELIKVIQSSPTSSATRDGPYVLTPGPATKFVNAPWRSWGLYVPQLSTYAFAVKM